MRLTWRNRWCYAALAGGVSALSVTFFGVSSAFAYVFAALMAGLACLLYPRFPVTRADMARCGVLVVMLGYALLPGLVLAQNGIDALVLIQSGREAAVTIGTVLSWYVLLFFGGIVLTLGLPFAMGAGLSALFGDDEAATRHLGRALDEFVGAGGGSRSPMQALNPRHLPPSAL